MSEIGPCPLLHEPSADTGWEIVGPVTLDGIPMHTHVLPCGDMQRHQLDPVCWCGPRQDDDYPMNWIHNSADGREAFETGRKPS